MPDLKRALGRLLAAISPFLLIILTVPVLIYRSCLLAITKRHRGGSLGKMLNASSTIHAVLKGQGTIVVPIVLDGRVNLTNVRKSIHSTLLTKRREGGTLMFPEITQTVVSFGGFLFWRDIETKDFAKDRITEVTGVQDLEGCESILRTLASKSWEFGAEPLWEVILVPIIGENKTTFIIRFHHALCDAHAAVAEVLNSFATKPLVLPNGNETVKRGWCRMALCFPKDITSLGISSLKSTRTLDRWMGNRDPSGKIAYSAESAPISLLKEAANLCQVSLTAIAIAILAKPVLELIRGRICFDSGEDVALYFPLPWHRKSEGLRNWGLVMQTVAPTNLVA